MCLLRGTSWTFKYSLLSILYIQSHLNLLELLLACEQVRTLKFAKCHSSIIHMPWSAGYLNVRKPRDRSQIMGYLMFSQRHCWGFRSSVTWHRVVGGEVPDVSKDSNAFIFRIIFSDCLALKMESTSILRNVVTAQKIRFEIKEYYKLHSYTKFDSEKSGDKKRFVTKLENAVTVLNH